MGIGLVFHMLAVIIWVGGMFFAYMVLRPGAGPLDAPARLSLWHRVFTRFFPWVWLSIAIILVSGVAMVVLGFGGFATAPAYVHAMTALGIVMMAVYAYLYFMPWQRLRRAVAAADWTAAGTSLGQIRQVVRFNLVLGLITAAIGAGGRFYG